MKKRIIFGMGALLAVATPIIAVVSCGGKSKAQAQETKVEPVAPVETTGTAGGTSPIGVNPPVDPTTNSMKPTVNPEVKAKTVDVISWLKSQDINNPSFGDENVDFSILNRALYTTDEANGVDIVAVKLDTTKPFQTLDNIDRCINFIKAHDERPAIIYVRGADDAPEPEIIKIKATLDGLIISDALEKLRELRTIHSIRKGFYQDGRAMSVDKAMLKDTTMILGNKLVFDQSKDPNYFLNNIYSWDRDAGENGYLNKKFDYQFALIRKFFADNADRNVHIAIVYLMNGNFKVALITNLAPLQKRPNTFEEFFRVIRDESSPNFRSFNFASEMYEYLDTL